MMVWSSLGSLNIMCFIFNVKIWIRSWIMGLIWYWARPWCLPGSSDLDLDQGRFCSWVSGEKQFENINKVETWVGVFETSPWMRERCVETPPLTVGCCLFYLQLYQHRNHWYLSKVSYQRIFWAFKCISCKHYSSPPCLLGFSSRFLSLFPWDFPCAVLATAYC